MTTNLITIWFLYTLVLFVF